MHHLCATRVWLVAIASFVCAFSLVLAGCAGGSMTHISRTPTPLPTGNDVTPPPGWYTVLPGMRFTDISATEGLAVSAAQPERLVGCALPVNSNSAGATLATSTDGGHSWQATAIAGVAPMQACALIADARNPATLVLGPEGSVSNIDPDIYESTDGGHAWQKIAPPNGYTAIGLAGSTTTLVAGHLLAMLRPPEGSADFALGERSPDGSWHLLNAPPGVSRTAWPPASWAVDPANPAHIYVAVYSGEGGVNITVLATRDGGASWQSLVTWPHGEIGVQLWTATGNRVYGHPVGDTGNTELFYFSKNGGATWTRTSLPDNEGYGGTGVVAVNPAGAVVVVIANEVLELDEATGKFVNVGRGPGEVQNGPGTFPDGFSCAVTLGSASALVCSGANAIGSDNYGFPLPAHLKR